MSVTDSRSIRQMIEAVVAKNGIDNFQLVLELTELFRKLGQADAPAKDIKERIMGAMLTGAQNAATREQIEAAIKTRLHVNPSGDRWAQLIEYAYLRAKEGENIETFINWWLLHGGEPQYWSPIRMVQLWPQAFVKRTKAAQEPIAERKYSPPPGVE